MFRKEQFSECEHLVKTRLILRTLSSCMITFICHAQT